MRLITLVVTEVFAELERSTGMTTTINTPEAGKYEIICYEFDLNGKRAFTISEIEDKDLVLRTLLLTEGGNVERLFDLHEPTSIDDLKNYLLQFIIETLNNSDEVLKNIPNKSDSMNLTPEIPAEMEPEHGVTGIGRGKRMMKHLWRTWIDD